MRAYLKGKGVKIWVIVNATSYLTTSATQEHNNANNKVVDILLLSLYRTEFAISRLLTRYGLTFKISIKVLIP
jgi:hypothetical protein